MRRITLGFAAFSLLACSSSSSGGGGGSGGDACSAFTDLCSKVTLAAFTASCGTTATSSESHDHASTNTDDPQVSSCSYKSSSGEAGSALRVCTPRGPTAAAAYYHGEKNAKLPFSTVVDVTGVGDEAFYRESLPINQTDLYVLQGPLIVVISDNEVPDGSAPGSKKDCLITIANAVLAAK